MHDTAQLKAEMEAKATFRKRWFEEEYDPDLHGDPYAIIAKDLLEVASAHIVKKAVEGFLRTSGVEFGVAGSSTGENTRSSPKKIPKSLTSINRFM